MAYEKGDLDVLENYLASDVYEDFKAVVTDRANKGFLVEAHFVGLREIRIRNVMFEEENMALALLDEMAEFDPDMMADIYEQQEDLMDSMVNNAFASL